MEKQKVNPGTVQKHNTKGLQRAVGTTPGSQLLRETSGRLSGTAVLSYPCPMQLLVVYLAFRRETVSF